MTGQPLTHDAATAATLIGCSERWLLEQARAGLVPSVQFGRTPRRFTDEHIALVIARNTHKQGQRRQASRPDAVTPFRARRRKAA